MLGPRNLGTVTVERVRDYLDWMCETGRGQHIARIDPQDLCWGCPLEQLGKVSVITAMVPELALDGINDMTKEVFIGARVVER